MTPPPEFSEPRRSFVKKTLATSVSISFAGLIRASGEEGGGTTEVTWATTCGTTVATTDPFGYTSTAPETTETWATVQTTTEGPATTTETTTLPKKPKHRVYTLEIWFKSANYTTGAVTWTTTKDDAVPHSGTVPGHPVHSGAPAANGGRGTLEAGGFPFGPGQKVDIQTNENHTSIDLNDDFHPNPNPYWQPLRDQASDQCGWRVQISYTWVYPTSP